MGYYEPLKRSPHQQRVDEFMLKAGQKVPLSPEMPDAETRLLRARLILEEAMETIELGLGVNILIEPCTTPGPSRPYRIDFKNLSFSADRKPDLGELVDGCCDLTVVTTGTLSAAGVADQLPQFLVDQNNLDKFGPGGRRHPETGKWIKPPGHKPPDIAGAIAAQMPVSSVSSES